MTQARAQLADLANRAVYGGEQIVLTRHGKPFAALISAADLAQLEAPRSAATSSSAAAGETTSSTQAYPLQVAATHSPPPERSGPSSW
jgi:prevent-host-death family protein